MIALVMAACSGPTAPEDQSEGAPPAPTPAPTAPVAPTPATGADATPAGDTVGGDGSPIILNALSAADLQAANLSGELGCSFASPTQSPLLVAKGDVGSKASAQGVVKVVDYVEQVGAKDGGGFGAMLKGATFVGRGKTVSVALTDAKPVGGGESPGYPATLTYDRADGARRVISGLWTCGP